MISSASCPIEITIDDDTEEFEGHPNSTLEIGPTINSRNWASEKIESPNNGRVQKEVSKDFCCTIPDLKESMIGQKVIIESLTNSQTSKWLLPVKAPSCTPQPYWSIL